VTASAWDDPVLTGSLGDRLAVDLRDAVRVFENSRDRSTQVEIGPSGIGKPCTRCLAREVLGMAVTRDFDDPWCRIIGTAVHAWLADALENMNTIAPEATYQTETRVHPHPDVLPKGGNADLYDAVNKVVIDHKVVGAEQLRKYRNNGPGQQYRIQAHLYGLGFGRLGKPVEHVAVAFWQRGGRLSDLYVWTEPYDAQIALDAINRYRTIRDQALAIGPAILPHLPADPDCWDCGGKDVDPNELTSIHPNPAPAA
jgi:hypothetical protein